MEKNKRIEIRISEADYLRLKLKSENAGISISDLIRNSALATRTWTAQDKRIKSEKVRQIARIGNNLNQIARFCNQHKSTTDTMEIVQFLVSIEHELKKVFQ